jgi:iron complex transport system substrate-binding protein
MKVYMKKLFSRNGIVIFALALTLFSLSWKNPELPKIVSCSSTMTEIVYELDGGQQVIGATSFCLFPEQVIEDKKSGRVAVVGDFIHIDYQKVAALKPDIILTDTNMQRKHADTLRTLGYNVLHFEPEHLEDVLSCIQEIGKAIGREENAANMVQHMRQEFAQIREVSEKLPKVQVYMEINHMGPWTFGSASPLQDLMEIAGGTNVFGDTATGVFMTNNAAVVKHDPDIILSPIWLDAESGGWKGITPLYEIYTRPGYSETSAVKRSRVLYYDSALMKHFGPRQVLATKKLAYMLHPENFSNPPDTIPWELGWIK